MWAAAGTTPGDATCIPGWGLRRWRRWAGWRYLYGCGGVGGVVGWFPVVGLPFEKGCSGSPRNAGATVPVPMATVIAAELEIVGSHGMTAHDYPTMLAEIASGTLSPQRLVQHRIDLGEAPAELAALDHQPGNGITIISPRRH